MEQKLGDSYLDLKNREKEAKQKLQEIRNELLIISKDIQNYLLESDKTSLQINNTHYLCLQNKEKKFFLKRNEYLEKITSMLYSKGIQDDQFISSLLNKTTNVVQEQKLVLKS